MSYLPKLLENLRERLSRLKARKVDGRQELGSATAHLTPPIRLTVLHADGEQLARALSVFLLCERDIGFLLQHDPKGVQQALNAIEQWDRHTR